MLSRRLFMVSRRLFMVSRRLFTVSGPVLSGAREPFGLMRNEVKRI